jgi:hypothetical protein
MWGTTKAAALKISASGGVMDDHSVGVLEMPRVWAWTVADSGALDWDYLHHPRTGAILLWQTWGSRLLNEVKQKHDDARQKFNTKSPMIG